MTIKGILVEVAYKRLGSISPSPDGLEKVREKVAELWRGELPPPSAPSSAAAVDGSRNRKDFAGYVVYALGAASMVFRGGEPGGLCIDADVDLLKPYEYSDSRLRTLMGILEFKRALSVLSEVDLLLLDGSVIGALLRPVAFFHEIDRNGELKKKAVALFEELKEVYSTGKINSKEFYRRVAEEFSGREYAVVSGYLEYLEYLYTIYLLLERAKREGKAVISVSKRSDSRHYELDNLLPDIAVLNLLNLPSGYSEPVSLSLTEEEKFYYPGEFEELLRSFEFTVSFVKPGDWVYKVEVFGDVDFGSALSYLNYYSVSGYPFPLAEVHRSVKITSADLEEVLRILKLRGITGREGLGE